MAKVTLTGVIQSISAIQTYSSGFTKRDIVIAEEGTKYPNPVKFTLKKDNCALADVFNEGDKVTVTASINGREWTNPRNQQVQYFIDLDAYKIDYGNGQEQVKPSGAKKGRNVPAPATPPADLSDNTIDDTDIPF